MIELPGISKTDRKAPLYESLESRLGGFEVIAPEMTGIEINNEI